MTRDEFKSFLAEFLMLDISEVHEESKLLDLGWDSLAFLSVVGVAEETWGIQLVESDLSECENVGDILNLFNDKWTTRDES